MSVLSNPWVVGIGGGVISGAVVTFITRYLFARRDNNEYRQRVEIAKSEVIHAVRPLVAEKIVPSAEMLDSILTATAAKRGVDKRDAYDGKSLADDIINEIASNPFLSSQQKVEFCDLVSPLKDREVVALGGPAPNAQENAIAAIEKRDAKLFVSVTLGLATGLMALLTTVMVAPAMDSSIRWTTDRVIPLIAALAAVPIVMSIMYALRAELLTRRVDRERERRLREINAILSDSEESSSRERSER